MKLPRLANEILCRDGKIISDTYNQTILSAAEALERLPKEENEGGSNMNCPICSELPACIE